MKNDDMPISVFTSTRNMRDDLCFFTPTEGASNPWHEPSTLIGIGVRILPPVFTNNEIQYLEALRFRFVYGDRHLLVSSVWDLMRIKNVTYISSTSAVVIHGNEFRLVIPSQTIDNTTEFKIEIDKMREMKNFIFENSTITVSLAMRPIR